MYIHVYIQVKEEKRLVHTVVDRCRNTIYIDCSGVYVYSDGAPPPEPPPEYAKRLDWVRRHDMPSEQHASLT
jgi:hypothetical protein